MMLQITGIMAAFLVMFDLAREDRWRWRAIWTMGITGVSIATYGLLQRAGVLPTLIEGAPGAMSFAGYGYWGDAGTYLNLVIPLQFGLWQSGVAKSRFTRGLVLGGLLLCVAAAFVNICAER